MLEMFSSPAGHHQSGQTFEEADVPFFLQIVQHFLRRDESRVNAGLMLLPVSRFFMLNDAYLLDQYVPPVEDGDAQFEGESHHGAEST